jgi:metal-responsive CopG/Arc/MetJ family transcriptional regulator
MDGNGVRINVSVSRKLYDDLKEVANRYGMTISEIIRQRLVEFLLDMKGLEEAERRENGRS